MFLSRSSGSWCAALAVAGALVLTACSGGGSTAGPRPSVTTSPDTAGSTGDPSASPAGPLEGSWLATTKGKAVALIVTGRQAALFATGGTLCSGTTGKKAGVRVIHLKCAEGGKDRTTGTVDSVTKASLKVTWQGGAGTETYTKAEGGELPSGLPTAPPGS
ncbi:hypothetical protein AB0K80_11965 [Streptomyces sp. NPDC052682]|uniref:hypothetical protein n=1 Tax=Streptomyces sp. NPDC052682 TaxID=3154954 RepID=UPI00341F633D